MSALCKPIFQPDNMIANGAVDVVLADDSEQMRRAIKRFLDDVAGIKILSEASTFAETLKMTAELKPTAVLMDLHMRDEREFKSEFIKAELLRSAKHVLAMSIWNDEETKALAQDYGASILLDKSTLASELVPAILQFS